MKNVTDLNDHVSILQGIIENTDEMIFSVDKMYKYTSFNEKHVSFMRLMFNKEPKIGISFLGCISDKKDREIAKDNLDKALAGNRLIREIPVGKESLTQRFFRISHNPIISATGDIIGVAVHARDLTEQKNILDELKIKDTELHILADASPGLIGSYHLRPDGSVCMPYTSPQIETLFGLKPEDVVNDATPLMERTHPDDDKRVRDTIVESGRTMTPWQLEYRVIHPTRGELWLESSTNPRPHPNGGTIWYGFVHDITRRKRAENALAKINRELRALSDCNQILLRAENEQVLTNHICHIICEEAGYKTAWVGYIEDDEHKVIRPVAWAGADSAYIGERGYTWADKMGDGRNAAPHEAYNGSTVLSQDISSDENMASLHEVARKHGYRSCIILPLKENTRKVFGVLVVFASETNAFTPEECTLMEQLSEDMAFGIENLRMRERNRLAEEALQRANTEMEHHIEKRTAELKKANEQLAALYKVGQVITAPLQLREVLDVIARNTATLLDSDTGVILLLDETTQTLTIRGAFGLRKEVIEGTHDKIGESIAGRVVQTGQPIIANDLPHDSRFYNPSARDEGLLACASVPLKAGDKIIGTLDIHSKTNRHAFNEEHIEILNLLASQAVIAIVNASLYEQLQHAHDELELRVKERTSELVLINDRLEEGIAKQKRIEGELQKSNTLLRGIIEAAPIAIFDLDPEIRVKTVWNPAAERIFGWKSHEVIGKILPTIPKDRSDEVQKMGEKIYHGQIIDGLEVKRQKRDGTIIDCTVYASPLLDSDGSIIGNVSVLADITERKQAEREIAAMNRVLRILSNTNQALIHLTNEKELLQEACRILVEIGGYRLAWVGYAENDEEKTIRPQACAGYDSGYIENTKISWGDTERGRGPGGTVIRTGQPCIVHDIPTEPSFEPWRESALKRGFKSIIALPLIFNNQVVGVIGIYSAETDSFNTKEVEILKELADDLAFGISTLRAREKKTEAEKALRTSEERFSAVFRYSPLAIILIRAEDGRAVDVNDTFIQLSEYPREEIIGHTTAEIGFYVNSSDRETLLTKLIHKNAVASYEFQAQTRSGEVKTVLAAMTTIEIMGESHYLVFVIDITERKKSEEKLHLLSAALESAANSIVITDHKAKIIWANDAFSKLTGFSLQESIGKGPRDLVYSGIHSAEFYKDMWKTILSGNEWHGEVINKRKDGTIYNEFMTITPVHDEQNEIRHFIAVKQNISKQKLVEEELLKAKEKAEESNRLKSAFLATMNHELRTPLNHILGFSDLMRSGIILENLNEYADLIYNSSHKLLEIIEDIFELALAEQSDIKLRLQTFSCLDLFLSNKEALYEILEISGKKEQIELVFNANKEVLLQHITSDKNKINQVLINLFKNAVKFTKSGRIEFGLKMDKPGWLSFYVEDTGIGIPEDKHKIVFEFFRQADDSYTREYGGVGIGLAISQKIAEVMHGTLSLESHPGKGSRFCFRIPVSGTKRAHPGIEKETNEFHIPDFHGKKVIIAEDDPVSIDLIKKYLSVTGIRIIEATNGDEVIEKLGANPDIILMDLNMPIMDGYTATKIIKAKRPDIPIIAITAYALSTDKSKATEAGCDGIISKPLEKVILYGELQKHI